MDYLTLRIEMAEDRLNMIKKFYRILMALILVTIAIVIFDFYVVHFHELNKFTLVCLGVLIANVIWLSSDLMSHRRDIKSESMTLDHLKKMEEDEEYIRLLKNLKGAEMQHKSAAEYYRDFKANDSCRESTQQESGSPVVEKT